MLSAPEEAKSEVVVTPLIYYQKPAIGNNAVDAGPPVQIVFPTGGFGLGIPVSEREHQANANPNGSLGFLMSPPMFTSLDLNEKRSLSMAFSIFFVINFIVTCLMYAYADVADPSKVTVGTGYLPSAFEAISTSRPYIQQVNFGFTLLMMLMGEVGVLTESALLISAYALGITVNFFLGTMALPYFLYALRYLLDMTMLYVALVFRSRLLCAFLPLHLHRP